MEIKVLVLFLSHQKIGGPLASSRDKIFNQNFATVIWFIIVVWSNNVSRDEVASTDSLKRDACYEMCSIFGDSFC